ncbi:MAG TPA: M48 family metallopeptidase [Aliarcobacter cryaerophilus]|nr:M48 family metallopeptidase [Aliarcobacter cryaerophilus]
MLMKFPLYIMEYIVIHELAHIKHKNHSKKFWELVEKYSPNYKEIEKIFKTLL